VFIFPTSLRGFARHLIENEPGIESLWREKQYSTKKNRDESSNLASFNMADKWSSKTDTAATNTLVHGAPSLGR
jgi:hypothetical protein